MPAYFRLKRTGCGGGDNLLASISIAALILAGSTAIAQTSTTATRSFSGIVVDDSGVPISGAVVHYNNSPATTRDGAGHVHYLEPLISTRVTTAKDGTFSVTGLPASIYWLCAAGTQPTHLRSCDWGSLPTQANLLTASVSQLKLTVPVGVMLTFNVVDTAAQIQEFPSSPTANGVATKPGNFRIFVMDGIRLMAATPAGAMAGVHQHTIAVPKVRTLRLLVDSKLNVLDQSNTAIPVGKPASSAIAVNGQPVNYKLTVQ